MDVIDRLIAEYPQSKYVDEVYFRRGEYFFVRRKFANAEAAYKSVVTMGSASSFYELSLYKLGWSLYKQEFYEEALHQYFALLDYKVSTGYDFDAKHEEEEAKRIDDTLQVVSLSLSNLGGPEVIDEYFATNGHRGYEDRVYRNFAEFYLTKRRYNDAATVYRSFVALNPHHVVAPRFSMRVVEIYDQGGFSKLVLESKKEFATRYGLHAEYWQYFDVKQAPDVLALREEQPEGSREPLSRAVSGRDEGRRQAGQLCRGDALVRRVHRFVPRRSGNAADQLSARRPAARAERLRRRRPRVRTHRIRLSTAREGGGRRLCGDLRASRTSQGGRRGREERREARDGRRAR